MGEAALNEQMHSRKPGEEVRRDFPYFQNGPSGEKAKAYLDSAASSQKPAVVVDRLTRYLSTEHANIHRGAYELSAAATEMYHQARQCVASFLGGVESDSCIFTRGTTEAINLIAHSLENQFQAGDTILLTLLEHHSNIVPWQLLAERKKLNIVFAEITDHAELDLKDFREKLKKEKPKLVSLTGLSNAFGSVVPIPELASDIKQAGAIFVVDAAQLAVHEPLRPAELGIDYLAFSGHKLYGPTGIGVLYVRPGMYDKMAPFLGGGDMIAHVGTNGSTWAKPPRMFEAGTPAIAEAIALGTATEYVESIGIQNIAEHERMLFEYAWEMLAKEEGVRLLGPANVSGKQDSIISFVVDSVHPHDLATVADSHGVQFRAGHHCAMPALERLGIQSTARISFGAYNIKDDIPPVVESIRHARKMFR